MKPKLFRIWLVKTRNDGIRVSKVDFIIVIASGGEDIKYRLKLMFEMLSIVVNTE